MAKDQGPDWEGIERDFRAGVRSIREIARSHTAHGIPVSEAVIRKRAKQKGWIRNLAARVRERVEAKLVRSEVRTPASPELEERAVEVEATRQIGVLVLQRRDITKLRLRKDRLLERLDRLVGRKRGRADGLTLGELALEASIIERVSRIDVRIQQLERAAWGLDRISGGDAGDSAPDAGGEDGDGPVTIYKVELPDNGR